MKNVNGIFVPNKFEIVYYFINRTLNKLYRHINRKKCPNCHKLLIDTFIFDIEGYCESCLDKFYQKEKEQNQEIAKNSDYLEVCEECGELTALQCLSCKEYFCQNCMDAPNEICWECTKYDF